MNRERLTILRDHLASLSDERLNMVDFFVDSDGEDLDWDTIAEAKSKLQADCGTAACIAGWALTLFAETQGGWGVETAAMEALGLEYDQGRALFLPHGFEVGHYSRSDAISAIQSMLDNPADDALPIWPERV